LERRVYWRRTTKSFGGRFGVAGVLPGAGGGLTAQSLGGGYGFLRRLIAKSFVRRFGATTKRGAGGTLETVHKELRRKIWCCWCTSGGVERADRTGPRRRVWGPSVG
jgi:hypothetical protein